MFTTKFDVDKVIIHILSVSKLKSHKLRSLTKVTQVEIKFALEPMSCLHPESKLFLYEYFTVCVRNSGNNSSLGCQEVVVVEMERFSLLPF